MTIIGLKRRGSRFTGKPKGQVMSVISISDIVMIHDNPSLGDVAAWIEQHSKPI